MPQTESATTSEVLLDPPLDPVHHAAASRPKIACIGNDTANDVLLSTGTQSEKRSSVAGRIQAPRTVKGFAPVHANQAKMAKVSRATKNPIACQVERARPRGRLARRIESGVRTRGARARKYRWATNQGRLKSSFTK